MSNYIYSHRNFYGVSKEEQRTVITNSLIKRNLSDLNIGISELFYKGFLRVSAAKAMKKKDFAIFLGKSLAVDYSVKKASWFERAFSVLIIVIAVIVVVLVTRNPGLVGSTISAMSSASVALAASVGVGILTIGGMVLGALGGPSAQGQIRMINGVAQILGIVATIAAIYSASTKYFLEQEAKQQAEHQVKKSALRTFADMVYDKVTEQIKSIYTSFTDFSDMSVSKASTLFGNIQKGTEMYLKFFAPNPAQLPEFPQEEPNTQTIEAFYVASERTLSYDAIQAMDTSFCSYEGGCVTDHLIINQQLT